MSPPQGPKVLPENTEWTEAQNPWQVYHHQHWVFKPTYSITRPRNWANGTFNYHLWQSYYSSFHSLLLLPSLCPPIPPPPPQQHNPQAGKYKYFSLEISVHYKCSRMQNDGQLCLREKGWGMRTGIHIHVKVTTQYFEDSLRKKHQVPKF